MGSVPHTRGDGPGYSAALGTGKQQSFVYDIADLYKLEITVPLAFRLAAQGPGRRGVPQDVGRYALLDLAVALHRARLSGPRSVRCTRGITPPPLNDPSRRNLSDPGAK